MIRDFFQWPNRDNVEERIAYGGKAVESYHSDVLDERGRLRRINDVKRLNLIWTSRSDSDHIDWGRRVALCLDIKLRCEPFGAQSFFIF